MSNVAPFRAGRVRRVRSIGTFTVRSRIIRATRRRSSSLSSANDFDRSTSTAEATMRIDASSPGSGSSSSPAPRHDAAVCPTVISRPSGSSVASGDETGSWSSIMSSASPPPSERYHASNASS